MSLQLIRGVYIADTARVLGRLTLGHNVNIWYGVIVRGDLAPITIGPNTNVQDAAVIHCDHDVPMTIGANVSVGHGAVVHGESIGDGTLIGMGAKLLGHTKVGCRCLIGAGSVLPPGMEVPDEMLVLGVPGRIVRPISDAEREYLQMIPASYVALAKRHVDTPRDPAVLPWNDG